MVREGEAIERKGDNDRRIEEEEDEEEEEEEDWKQQERRFYSSFGVLYEPGGSPWWNVSVPGHGTYASALKAIETG
jgi:hypothetical protein